MDPRAADAERARESAVALEHSAPGVVAGAPVAGRPASPPRSGPCVHGARGTGNERPAERETGEPDRFASTLRPPRRPADFTVVLPDRRRTLLAPDGAAAARSRARRAGAPAGP